MDVNVCAEKLSLISVTKRRNVQVVQDMVKAVISISDLSGGSANLPFVTKVFAF